MLTDEVVVSANVVASFRTVYPLSDSTLLLGTFSGFMLYNVKTYAATQIGDASMGEVRSIQALVDGVLFLATYGKGLYLYDFKSLYTLPLDERVFLHFLNYMF